MWNETIPTCKRCKYACELQFYIEDDGDGGDGGSGSGGGDDAMDNNLLLSKYWQKNSKYLLTFN